MIPLTENTNPVRPVARSAESDYTAVIVDPKQALAILLGMRQPERTLTLLVAATGLRISEALGLKWEDIDYLKQRICITRAY
ncbi:MAG TPA: tyrosine-type recombinase/integrase [Candidatus Sulfotelmatobacter sp.]|nr:tyrosine-type recombinase/integrase [Candidatus Sulfotelmatobacter sp.]